MLISSLVLAVVLAFSLLVAWSLATISSRTPPVPENLEQESQDNASQ